MGWYVSAKVLPFRVKFRSRDVFGRGGARGAVEYAEPQEELWALENGAG